ncbi:hypothetical protein ACJMK2_044130 [Sinanodonta woodiana]|uniref:HECT domain-containing protein n=1 Tax=Sinanodonta woodiana TaxID=1069815 RepID=A0ABD3VZ54_SINWO
MTRRLSLNSNLSDVIARNGLDSVAALLDGDRRAPNNNYILDRSSSRSRMVGSTSVEDEVRSLFSFFFLKLGDKQPHDFCMESILYSKCPPYPVTYCSDRSGSDSLVQLSTPNCLDLGLKAHDAKAYLGFCLTECTYYKAGQMLAYFSMHRGPSPNFISHILYMALAEGIASIQPAPNEICDYELRGQVEAIAAASNEEDFKAAFVKAVELINFAGCMSLTLHFNQDGQTALVKSLTKFVVCDRIQSPFEQPWVWLMKINKKHWKEVFIFTIKPLDALQLDNMFDVKWLTEGSNQKRIEERILVYWRDFLQYLEGTLVTYIEHIVAVTEWVPAHGFNFPLQLSFIHPEDLQDVAKCCTAGFPYANTCTMKLKIQVVNDCNTFQRNMAAAISMTVTFTNQ